MSRDQQIEPDNLICDRFLSFSFSRDEVRTRGWRSSPQLQQRSTQFPCLYAQARRILDEIGKGAHSETLLKRSELAKV
jgi:hypothetical protein